MHFDKDALWGIEDALCSIEDALCSTEDALCRKLRIGRGIVRLMKRLPEKTI